LVNNPPSTRYRRDVQIVGADGCKAGWIAVAVVADDLGRAQARNFANFAELVGAFEPDAILTVDMPIGLPDRAIGGGRAADWAARDFLESRRASVFPVPSRQAVYAFEQRYAQACAIARATSDPPKCFSKQAFWIFPRIQQIDVLLRGDPALRRRVFEVHPEVSFAVMNNGAALRNGKKAKEGKELRRELLAKQGFATDFLEAKSPRGAAWDDFYDACACAWSGRRILAGVARVFPEPPEVDSEGLPVAIRA
jgi:predicted RNase H-like nuclease